MERKVECIGIKAGSNYEKILEIGTGRITRDFRGFHSSFMSVKLSPLNS